MSTRRSMYALKNFAEQTEGSKVLLQSSEVEHIRQSLLLILSIRQGERSLAPSFGNHLHQFCFSPNTASLCKAIQGHIADIIQVQEPRIHNVEVAVEPILREPTKLKVQLRYRLNSDQSSQHLFSYLDLHGALNGSDV